MPEVPKIVQARLRAGALSTGHPDPDLLTAFAEQTLSAAEREGVLQHLAVCGDCREVIAIALPASESVFVPQGAPEEEEAAATVRQPRPRMNWFGWLGLRGAALAAGVLVVASVLILRPGKQPQPRVESTVASVNSQAEQVVAEPASAKPAGPSVEPRLTATVKPEELRLSNNEAGRAKLDSPFSRESRIAPAREPAELAKMQPGAALRDRKRADRSEADKLAPMAAAPAVSGAVSGGSVSEVAGVSPAAVQQAPPANAEAVTARAATEAVEVSGASPVVETKDSAASQNVGLLARNMETLPIEKAKAPVPSAAEKAATASRTKKQAVGASSNYAVADEVSARALAATWQLSGGTLQRSLDAGASWQTVLRADHPLLCHSARGPDIWAAGQAGTVFHSSDGGVTWTELHPAVMDQLLTADITGIAFQKPGEAVLTSGGESWITMDNGKTWTKK